MIVGYTYTLEVCVSSKNNLYHSSVSSLLLGLPPRLCDIYLRFSHRTQGAFIVTAAGVVELIPFAPFPNSERNIEIHFAPISRQSF